MQTQEEGVITIYKDNELVAIAKRDDVSKKHLVYIVKEATVTDIAAFISDNTSRKT